MKNARNEGKLTQLPSCLNCLRRRERFKFAAGIDIVHVLYEGTPKADVTKT